MTWILADVSIPASSASFGNAEFLLSRFDAAGETISDNLLRLLLRLATGRGKEYPKWLVVIPPKVIEELGWKEGDET